MKKPFEEDRLMLDNQQVVKKRNGNSQESSSSCLCQEVEMNISSGRRRRRSNKCSLLQRGSKLAKMTLISLCTHLFILLLFAPKLSVQQETYGPNRIVRSVERVKNGDLTTTDPKFVNHRGREIGLSKKSFEKVLKENKNRFERSSLEQLQVAATHQVAKRDIEKANQNNADSSMENTNQLTGKDGNSTANNNLQSLDNVVFDPLRKLNNSTVVERTPTSVSTVDNKMADILRRRVDSSDNNDTVGQLTDLVSALDDSSDDELIGSHNLLQFGFTEHAEDQLIRDSGLNARDIYPARRNLNASLEARAKLRDTMNQLHYNKTLALERVAIGQQAKNKTNNRPTVGVVGSTVQTITVSPTAAPINAIEYANEANSSSDLLEAADETHQPHRAEGSSLLRRRPAEVSEWGHRKGAGKRASSAETSANLAARNSSNGTRAYEDMVTWTPAAGPAAYRAGSGYQPATNSSNEIESEDNKVPLNHYATPETTAGSQLNSTVSGDYQPSESNDVATMRQSSSYPTPRSRGASGERRYSHKDHGANKTLTVVVAAQPTKEMKSYKTVKQRNNDSPVGKSNPIEDTNEQGSEEDSDEGDDESDETNADDRAYLDELSSSTTTERPNFVKNIRKKTFKQTRLETPREQESSEDDDIVTPNPSKLAQSKRNKTNKQFRTRPPNQWIKQVESTGEDRDSSSSASKQTKTKWSPTDSSSNGENPSERLDIPISIRQDDESEEEPARYGGTEYQGTTRRHNSKSKQDTRQIAPVIKTIRIVSDDSGVETTLKPLGSRGGLDATSTTKLRSQLQDSSSQSNNWTPKPMLKPTIDQQQSTTISHQEPHFQQVSSGSFKPSFQLQQQQQQRIPRIDQVKFANQPMQESRVVSLGQWKQRVPIPQQSGRLNEMRASNNQVYFNQSGSGWSRATRNSNPGALDKQVNAIYYSHPVQLSQTQIVPTSSSHLKIQDQNYLQHIPQQVGPSPLQWSNHINQQPSDISSYYPSNLKSNWYQQQSLDQTTIPFNGPSFEQSLQSAPFPVQQFSPVAPLEFPIRHLPTVQRGTRNAPVKSQSSLMQPFWDSQQSQRATRVRAKTQPLLSTTTTTSTTQQPARFEQDLVGKVPISNGHLPPQHREFPSLNQLDHQIPYMRRPMSSLRFNPMDANDNSDSYLGSSSSSSRTNGHAYAGQLKTSHSLGSFLIPNGNPFSEFAAASQFQPATQYEMSSSNPNEISTYLSQSGFFPFPYGSTLEGVDGFSASYMNSAATMPASAFMSPSVEINNQGQRINNNDQQQNQFVKKGSGLISAALPLATPNSVPDPFGWPMAHGSPAAKSLLKVNYVAPPPAYLIPAKVTAAQTSALLYPMMIDPSKGSSTPVKEDSSILNTAPVEQDDRQMAASGNHAMLESPIGYHWPNRYSQPITGEFMIPQQSMNNQQVAKFMKPHETSNSIKPNVVQVTISTRPPAINSSRMRFWQRLRLFRRSNSNAKANETSVSNSGRTVEDLATKRHKRGIVDSLTGFMKNPRQLLRPSLNSDGGMQTSESAPQAEVAGKQQVAPKTKLAMMDMEDDSSGGFPISSSGSRTAFIPLLDNSFMVDNFESDLLAQALYFNQQQTSGMPKYLEMGNGSASTQIASYAPYHPPRPPVHYMQQHPKQSTITNFDALNLMAQTSNRLPLAYMQLASENNAPVILEPPANAPGALKANKSPSSRERFKQLSKSLMKTSRLPLNKLMKITDIRGRLQPIPSASTTIAQSINRNNSMVYPASIAQMLNSVASPSVMMSQGFSSLDSFNRFAGPIQQWYQQQQFVPAVTDLARFQSSRPHQLNQHQQQHLFPLATHQTQSLSPYTFITSARPPMMPQHPIARPPLVDRAPWTTPMPNFSKTSNIYNPSSLSKAINSLQINGSNTNTTSFANPIASAAERSFQIASLFDPLEENQATLVSGSEQRDPSYLDDNLQMRATQVAQSRAEHNSGLFARAISDLQYLDKYQQGIMNRLSKDIIQLGETERSQRRTTSDSSYDNQSRFHLHKQQSQPMNQASFAFQRSNKQSNNWPNSMLQTENRSPPLGWKQRPTSRILVANVNHLQKPQQQQQQYLIGNQNKLADNQQIRQQNGYPNQGFFSTNKAQLSYGMDAIPSNNLQMMQFKQQMRPNLTNLQISMPDMLYPSASNQQPAATDLNPLAQSNQGSSNAILQEVVANSDFPNGKVVDQTSGNGDFSLEQQQQFQQQLLNQPQQLMMQPSSGFVGSSLLKPRLPRLNLPSINSMASRLRQHLYQTFRLNPLSARWPSMMLGSSPGFVTYPQSYHDSDLNANNQQAFQSQQQMHQQQPLTADTSIDSTNLYDFQTSYTPIDKPTFNQRQPPNVATSNVQLLQQQFNPTSMQLQNKYQQPKQSQLIKTIGQFKYQQQHGDNSMQLDSPNMIPDEGQPVEEFQMNTGDHQVFAQNGLLQNDKVPVTVDYGNATIPQTMEDFQASGVSELQEQDLNSTMIQANNMNSQEYLQQFNNQQTVNENPLHNVMTDVSNNLVTSDGTYIAEEQSSGNDISDSSQLQRSKDKQKDGNTQIRKEQTFRHSKPNDREANITIHHHHVIVGEETNPIEYSSSHYQHQDLNQTSGLIQQQHVVDRQPNDHANGQEVSHSYHHDMHYEPERVNLQARNRANSTRGRVRKVNGKGDIMMLNRSRTVHRNMQGSAHRSPMDRVSQESGDYQVIKATNNMDTGNNNNPSEIVVQLTNGTVDKHSSSSEFHMTPQQLDEHSTVRGGDLSGNSADMSISEDQQQQQLVIGQQVVYEPEQVNSGQAIYHRPSNETEMVVTGQVEDVGRGGDSSEPNRQEQVVVVEEQAFNESVAESNGDHFEYPPVRTVSLQPRLRSSTYSNGDNSNESPFKPIIVVNSTAAQSLASPSEETSLSSYKPLKDVDQYMIMDKPDHLEADNSSRHQHANNTLASNEQPVVFVSAKPEKVVHHQRLRPLKAPKGSQARMQNSPYLTAGNSSTSSLSEQPASKQDPNAQENMKHHNLKSSTSAPIASITRDSFTRPPKAKVRWQGVGANKSMHLDNSTTGLKSELSSSETNRVEQQAWIVGGMTHQTYASSSTLNGAAPQKPSIFPSLESTAQDSKTITNTTSAPTTSVTNSSYVEQSSEPSVGTEPTAMVAPAPNETSANNEQPDRVYTSYGGPISSGGQMSKLQQQAELASSRFHRYKSSLRSSSQEAPANHRPNHAETTNPSIRRDSRTAPTSFRLAPATNTITTQPVAQSVAHNNQSIPKIFSAETDAHM